MLSVQPTWARVTSKVPYPALFAPDRSLVAITRPGDEPQPLAVVPARLGGNRRRYSQRTPVFNAAIPEHIPVTVNDVSLHAQGPNTHLREVIWNSISRI